MSGSLTNALRKELGLPELRSFSEQAAKARQLDVPSVYGFSEHVIPGPADWDELQHITGNWPLQAPPDWQPTPALLDFLGRGPPPVYVGFGSINPGDSKSKTELILRALAQCRQRGVILTGWGGLTRLDASDEVFFVDDVPHDWLFPKMAALVHHGGAGTTGEGLRSGVPNIITPVGTDQFAWAERVVDLGVGPKAQSMRSLTVDGLVQAVSNAINLDDLRARASALGAKIRAENGIARAVELFERKAREVRKA
jgi:sterol 3beta-glucosyltransferase